MTTPPSLPSTPPSTPSPLTKYGDITTSIHPTTSTLTTPPQHKTQIYTQVEVNRHNTEKDLWIIVKGDIYDMTAFQHEHPGGRKLIQKVGGKDATKQFQKFHRDALLLRYEDRVVGRVQEGLTKEGLFGFLRR